MGLVGDQCVDSPAAADAVPESEASSEAVKPKQQTPPASDASEAVKAKPSPPARRPTGNPATPVPVLGAALAVALVGAVVQESNIVNGGSVPAWYRSLLEEHVVPPPKAKKDTCTIMFCQSCGTNGVYNQIAHILNQRASKPLRVTPTNYPAPPLNQFIATVIANLQYILILVVLMSDTMLPEGIRENKMAALMFIFFAGSMLSSTVTKTSAFEIYVGRKLVYSALSNERMPNMQDLVRGFKAVGIQIAS